MKRTAAFIFFTLSVMCSHAQENDRRGIVSAIIKEGYPYIPANAFDDSVKGIVNTFDHLDSIKNKKEIMFRWYSIEIDGSFNLAITPEQVFFYSGHDNPNHNFFYWVMSIDRAQYEYIFKGLKKTHRLYTHKYSNYYTVTFNTNENTNFPKWWREEGEPDSVRESYCDKKRRKHLEKYFSLMNTFIPKGQKKLVLPTESELEKYSPKLTSTSEEEIFSWGKHKKRKA